MTPFCICTAIAGFIAFIVYSIAKTTGSYRKLVDGGIPARGIVLAVAQTGSKSSAGGFSLESRTIRLDVEIPGQAPYEINTSVIFPANLRGDVLPGATVELRVDPKKRDQVAIVGPGVGFAATSPVAAPAPALPPTSPGSS